MVGTLGSDCFVASLLAMTMLVILRERQNPNRVTLPVILNIVKNLARMSASEWLAEAQAIATNNYSIITHRLINLT